MLFLIKNIFLNLKIDNSAIENHTEDGWLEELVFLEQSGESSKKEFLQMNFAKKVLICCRHLRNDSDSRKKERKFSGITGELNLIHGYDLIHGYGLK